MRTVALDTSVVIAALLAWHEHHEAAADAVSRALARDRVVLPVPVLIESYSVMTRLPAPHRLTAADAWAVLSESFREPAHLASFPTREAWGLVRQLSENELAGGLVYDAVILEAAREGGASILLTFNERDYERLDRDGVEIVVPS